MSQYGYGRAGANPYDQRGGDTQPYAQPSYGGQPSPQYGRQPYSQPAMGRDDYAGQYACAHEGGDDAHLSSTGQNVEMEPLAQNGSQFGQAADPNAILNACREVDRGIQEIKEAMRRLAIPQQHALDDPGSNSSAELGNANSEIMAMFRNLTGKVKDIKLKPESGSPRNSAQVGKIDRDLKECRQKYLQTDAEFNNKVKEQAMRQYRIVRPDATEQEVRAAAEDPGQQMFSQAMMQSDRRGQSRAVLSAVQDRNAAIKKIESQMIELAEMFQDMDNLVVQQEAAVVNIEMKGEEVVENLDKGNEQIGTAIQSARNTRKWKWWCLGICVLIVIIIVVIVLIYKFVIQNNGSSKRKRFVLPDFVSADQLAPGRHVLAGQPWSSKSVIPGQDWAPPSSAAVAPGADWIPTSRKFRRFAA
ncbi:SSO2 protein [Marssonina coronariae]|uniref:SSO2 protein n=1 Tax=Diplocarpon coronariae TaxID=2795749 RepID=A0A218ZB62_9HELO|nr:SSO2 protein [Marssonina coronariae]